MNFKGETINFIGTKSNYLWGFVSDKTCTMILMVYRDSTIQVWDIINGENIDMYQKLKKPVNSI